MARDPNIPLFLWVAAAIVAHLTWGGGAEQVAEVFEERADVRRFAASVHNQLRRRFSTEIALLDDSTISEPARESEEPPDNVDGPPDDDTADEKKAEPPKDTDPKDLKPVVDPERERSKPKEPVKPEPAKKKQEEKKAS